MLCKCGWDFDHFDQFDQKHAFSNHNPKRMTIGFVLRELLTIIKHCKNNEKQRMKLKFHFIPCLFSSLQKRKERKDCQIHVHPSTNNFHPFSLIQYHQTNHNQSQSNHDENEKRKRWKWTSSTTIEQIETPSFNARVKRGWKQTTLPQLPAFPAFCKCNEHPITSNAHWYPSGHSCRPRSVPLML